MTIVRALDATHDWTFGRGKNNYVTRNAAVIQNVNTRLSCFLNDCFFDIRAGLDWFGLLGAKDQTALNLALSATILNTPEVTKLTQLLLQLNSPTRILTVQYQVVTIYSVASGIYTFTNS